ncbi:MAG: FHA domain-containing protein [Pirellulales bacterium]
MSEWKTQLEQVEHSAVARTLEESKLIQPMRRVAYPRLTLLDDGKIDEGEIIRIRKEDFIIGRSEGDLTFPLESLMSSRHCRLTLLQKADQEYHWTIEDLGSRHGTYLRCAEVSLVPGMEFLAGGTRFRLIGPKRLRMATPTNKIEYYQGTFDSNPKVEQLEVCSYSISHSAQHLKLNQKKVEVGRLNNQVLSTDPFLEPVHFSMEKTSDAWKIVDRKSHNGIWVRIQSTRLSSYDQLTIGEQRLVFQLPTIY